jgi:hypothetical protein
MATKITGDIIESFLNCKFKDHLKRAGNSGTKSDDVAMTATARGNAKRPQVDPAKPDRPAASFLLRPPPPDGGELSPGQEPLHLFRR